MSDILDDEEKAALAVGPGDDETPDDAPPPADDTPRDEKGRFAPKADDAPTDEPSDDKPKGDGKVPQGALHAERERRKATETQLKEAQEQLTRIAELRAKLAGGDDPAPQDAPPADGNEVEYLKAELAKLKQGQQQTSNFLQNQQLDQAETNQLFTVLQQSENEFRASTPDYDAAIAHLAQKRADELALYGLQPFEIQQTLQQEVMDISRAAIAQKRNPAELGYEIAKSRGYIAQVAPPAEQPAPTGGKAQDIVRAIATAQAQGKSLGQASGGATAQTINAQTIGQMTQEEFDALYATDEGRRLIDSLA